MLYKMQYQSLLLVPGSVAESEVFLITFIHIICTYIEMCALVFPTSEVLSPCKVCVKGILDVYLNMGMLLYFQHQMCGFLHVTDLYWLVNFNTG